MLAPTSGEMGTSSVDQPFLVLSDEGRNSRVYLGRVSYGESTPPRYVAIKVQTPRTGTDASADSADNGDAGRSHSAREAAWQRELEHYLAVQDVEIGFSPLLLLDAPSERTGKKPAPRAWPPLLYCAEQNALFPAHSPAGTPLQLCRDDAVLADSGLPPYQGSTQTFLYSPEDMETEPEPRFYGCVADGEQGHPKAGSFADLVEALASVPGMPDAGTPSVSSASDIRRFARTASSLACLGCEERDTCYGEGLFKERLRPFSLEETNALVLELNQFHYDELCDLMGGISLREFEKKYLGEGVGAGPRNRLAGVEPLLEFGSRYLFANDGSGMDALEIFRLKWSLFTETVQAAFEYERRSGAAHLRIEPRHVMAQLGKVGRNLPAMWQFEARLISLGSARLNAKPEQGDPGELLLPPANSNPTYDAEIIRNSSFGVVQRGSFTLNEITPAAKEGFYTLTADLEHEGLGMPWLSPKDRVKIILRHIYESQDLAFFASRDPESNYSQRVLNLQSFPLELNEQQIHALERIRGVGVHNSAFAVYPAFQSPCDIYSLGVLLFRTFLVNDAQALGDIMLSLNELKPYLPSTAAYDYEEDEESKFWEALMKAHPRPEETPIFDRCNVFYGADDRDADRPNAIPEELWREALTLGLQMITEEEDFSFCAHHADYEERYPAGKMEHVLHRCQTLLRKLETALFSSSAKNAEIRAALEAIAAESV